MVDDKTQKWVERLSLLFDFEDKNLFKQRVQLCKHYQQRAEDEIRFQNYSEKVPENEISELSEDTVENIKYKSWIKKKKYKDDDLIWASQLSGKIMKTVKAEYTREMKKCHVLNEMKNRASHPKFKELRIKVRSQINSVPFYGTIDKLEYDKHSFNQLSSHLMDNHSTHEPWIVEALKMFSERNTRYMYKELFIFKLNKADLPFKLSSFMTMQKSNHTKSLQSLHIQWREYVSNEISGSLRLMEDYNPSIPSKEEYMEPRRLPMRRFLKRVDLIFRESVKTLAEFNIQQWLNTCKQFVMETTEDLSKDVWRINEKPMIYVNIKTKERKKKEKDTELFYFEPSQKTILKRLQEPLHWLIKAINSFKTLEPDIVNMINLESKIAFEVDENTPMFAKAFEYIDYLVTRGLEKPLEILQKFHSFKYLLEKPTEDIAK